MSHLHPSRLLAELIPLAHVPVAVVNKGEVIPGGGIDGEENNEGGRAYLPASTPPACPARPACPHTNSR
jgi:hypothetical protein